MVLGPGRELYPTPCADGGAVETSRAISQGGGPLQGGSSHVFASVAQFECERISERTREGLAVPRKAGQIGGRPPALVPSQRSEVCRIRDEDGRRIAEIARFFGVSPNTVRRA